MYAEMYAEWVAVTTSVSDDTIYIDPEIRRKGELVEMWALIDSKLAKHLPPASYFLSMRLLQLSGGTGRHSLSLFTSYITAPFPMLQYNCTEERMRLLAVTPAHVSTSQNYG
jgi:hypothetical protein